MITIPSNSRLMKAAGPKNIDLEQSPLPLFENKVIIQVTTVEGLNDELKTRVIQEAF